MRILVFAALLALCGCGPSTQQGPAKQLVNTASAVTLTKLPDMPPPPSLEPTAATVAQAQAATQAAQANVRQAMSAQPPPAVIVPLSEADGQLTTAIGQQAAAVADLKEKHVAVATRDVERQNREGAYRTQFETLKAKTESDAKANQKLLDASAHKISDLQDENKKLQEELQGWGRRILYGVGGVFIVGGLLALMAWFWLGFAAGWKVAVMFVPVGLFCFAIAHYLAQIQLAIIILLGLAALAAVGYGIIKTFVHVPIPKGQGAGKQ